MKSYGVSIVLPLFKPDQKVLNKVIDSLKKQQYKGKVEIIQINENAGFSHQMNLGIKKSKYPIVVMLPQDCVPSTKNWLSNLIEPFKDKEVVASVSKVQLPEELWQPMSIFAKALILKERGTITSLLDGKGGAYRKSVMEKIGLFDEKTFKTAGEDFDTYIKLKKIGKIAYPDAKVLHLHPTAFVKRIRKDYQYANGYGALVRIYWNDMPHWYIGLFKAIPVMGIIAFGLTYPFRKGISLLVPFLFTIPFSHIFYIYGFWKGFLMKRQTV
ncbi:glycosyltransferase family 2 protein [Candidatus Pacearchaeota archaeon]|nr:glycosyltransferase family 2 protein [Candidatus Pacearchaeota archaeon]